MNKTAFYLLFATVITALSACSARGKYQINEGQVFGTYYAITYSSPTDLQPQIESLLQDFDNSLSVYNENSIISKINRNEEVTTDALFNEMYATAMEVSELSQGAFDITVMPLVNAWGFGWKERDKVTQADIDSLMTIIGYTGIWLRDNRIVKRDPRMMLDASALAKGYACDKVAELLAKEGSENYLVEIGGEVVARGRNPKGQPWRVGIEKPIDDPSGQQQAFQDIIETDSICMATSGNYRNYYYENGTRRSHTIDPTSGYPVQHQLLSATVIASTCMLSDALATACMVMGTEKSLQLINLLPDAKCYLIVAKGERTEVVKSDNWDNSMGSR